MTNVRKRVGLAALGLVGLLAFAFGGGFFVFVGAVARVEPEAVRQADGIVALTGGAQRLTDALALLERGQAKRLLVTGVHPSTSRQDLARMIGVPARLIECCIDLDHEALNTVGNAMEAAGWARRHGFASVIVVTSTYHMPRTLMELRRRMPGVELVPYPVVSGGINIERWWEHAPTARLLVTEYVKYALALARPLFRAENAADAGSARAQLSTSRDAR